MKGKKVQLKEFLRRRNDKDRELNENVPTDKERCDERRNKNWR